MASQEDVSHVLQTYNLLGATEEVKIAYLHQQLAKGHTIDFIEDLLNQVKEAEGANHAL